MAAGAGPCRTNGVQQRRLRQTHGTAIRVVALDHSPLNLVSDISEFVLSLRVFLFSHETPPPGNLVS